MNIVSAASSGDNEEMKDETTTASQANTDQMFYKRMSKFNQVCADSAVQVIRSQQSGAIEASEENLREVLTQLSLD